jgi:hypothetical protein
MSRGKAGEFSLEVGASQHQVTHEIERPMTRKFVRETQATRRNHAIAKNGDCVFAVCAQAQRVREKPSEQLGQNGISQRSEGAGWCDFLPECGAVDIAVPPRQPAKRLDVSLDGKAQSMMGFDFYPAGPVMHLDGFADGNNFAFLFLDGHGVCQGIDKRLGASVEQWDFVAANFDYGVVYAAPIEGR